MYYFLLATVSLTVAQLNLEGSARYWCFSFSVSNCHAFQKFMSSLLWLNKKSSILWQSRRYAAHSVHCACSIFCQRLALLSVFISRGFFLFPLLHHSQPTYCLCCFHFLAEPLFFSKKENSATIFFPGLCLGGLVMSQLLSFHVWMLAFRF